MKKIYGSNKKLAAKQEVIPTKSWKQLTPQIQTSVNPKESGSLCKITRYFYGK